MADESKPQLVAAKKLLEKHGYRVIDPPCPECKGAGVVYKVAGDNCGMSAGRCPKGCPPPQMFNGITRQVPITDARARSTRMHDL